MPIQHFLRAFTNSFMSKPYIRFFTKGGVYPYLLHPFTHVLFMPCNCEPQFGRCLILLSSPSNTKHSVDLPCPHDIHRTLNTVSIYHGQTPNTVSTLTMHSFPTQHDVSCKNVMQMSLHAISCLHVHYV